MVICLFDCIDKSKISALHLHFFFFVKLVLEMDMLLGTFLFLRIQFIFTIVPRLIWDIALF